MRKALHRIEICELYHYCDMVKKPGAHSGMSGDWSRIWGNCSGISGDCTRTCGCVTNIWGDITDTNGDVSGLIGYCTPIHGNCTGIQGRLDDCEIFRLTDIKELVI